MKKLLSLISFIGLSVILVESCEKKQYVQKSEGPASELKRSEPLIAEADPLSEVEYSIQVEKIDSMQYYSTKNKIKLPTHKMVKISDFKEAGKLLKGIVEFIDSDDEYHIIKQINFKNGTELKSTTGLDFSFVAYYPEEDILLCEGGHSSDVSYNLKTGKETEETGNPDLITSSPQNRSRLNGNFGGQECYSYFIQRKIEDQFVKIIQLDEEFEKLTGVWLCTIGESFWSNEKTLYLTETDFVEKGISRQYFKVNLIEK